MWWVGEGGCATRGCGSYGLASFAGEHGLSHPLVSLVEVFGAGGLVTAGEVDVTAKREREVLHRVVVIGPELDGAVGVVEAVLDERGVAGAEV